MIEQFSFNISLGFGWHLLPSQCWSSNHLHFTISPSKSRTGMTSVLNALTHSSYKCIIGNILVIGGLLILPVSFLICKFIFENNFTEL